MASCSFCSLVIVLLLLVISLSLTIVAIITDVWFTVETNGVVTESFRRENNYNFGFWRRCYDEAPTSIPSGDLVGSDNDCVMIYEDLLKRSDVNTTSDEELVMNLSISYIGLAIGSGAGQLAVVIVLLCGSWPGDCHKMKKPTLYVISSLVLLVATMAGIACGVCFIAARDVEEKELLMYRTASTSYGWSFMLHWIASGLCLVNGFLLLCMLKYAYDDVNDNAKYYYTM